MLQGALVIRLLKTMVFERDSSTPDDSVLDEVQPISATVEDYGIVILFITFCL